MALKQQGVDMRPSRSFGQLFRSQFFQYFLGVFFFVDVATEIPTGLGAVAAPHVHAHPAEFMAAGGARHVVAPLKENNERHREITER